MVSVALTFIIVYSQSYGFTANVRFTLKCLVVKDPGLTVICTLSASTLILAYILRIFEIEYYRSVGHHDNLILGSIPYLLAHCECVKDIRANKESEEGNASYVLDKESRLFHHLCNEIFHGKEKSKETTCSSKF